MSVEGLKKPFPADSISWRIGAQTKDKSKCIPLAYLDARDVMGRLDEVMGPLNWQARYPWSDNKRLYCEIGIRYENEWIWKGNGAGDTHIEAEKGAFSDAFKRAAVLWGVGEYLYHLPNVWVECEGNKIPAHVLADLTSRLNKWQERL